MMIFGASNLVVVIISGIFLIYTMYTTELDMYVPGDPESPFLSNLLKCLMKFTSFLLVTLLLSPSLAPFLPPVPVN